MAGLMLDKTNKIFIFNYYYYYGLVLHNKLANLLVEYHVIDW